MTTPEPPEERVEGVLLRIVEWMEWIPSRPSKEHPALSMTNGFTGFNTLKDERMVDIAVSGTGRNYEWEEEDPDNPDAEKVKIRYGLYAFQAVLARNVPTDQLDILRSSQALLMEEELARDAERGRDRREDLIVVEKQPPKPNRNDRRGGKAKPRRKHS